MLWCRTLVISTVAVGVEEGLAADGGAGVWVAAEAVGLPAVLTSWGPGPSRTDGDASDGVSELSEVLRLVVFFLTSFLCSACCRLYSAASVAFSSTFSADLRKSLRGILMTKLGSDLASAGTSPGRGTFCRTALGSITFTTHFAGSAEEVLLVLLLVVLLLSDGATIASELAGPAGEARSPGRSAADDALRGVTSRLDGDLVTGLLAAGPGLKPAGLAAGSVCGCSAVLQEVGVMTVGSR